MPPRPIVWGEGKREEFLQYLDLHLTGAIGYRQGLEAKWRKWLQMYRAPSDQPKKRFPFEGSSNYVLPVMATDVDQMYARIMQTIHATENLWSITPMNESWVPAAKPMQDFLQLLDQRMLKMFHVNSKAVLEKVKLGTCIYKTYWHYEQRPISNARKGGQRKLTMTRAQPVVDHIPLADFLIPPNAISIDPEAQGGAEWVAQRLRLTPIQFKSISRASMPALPNMSKEDVDMVLVFVEQGQTAYMDEVRRQEYEKQGNTSLVEWEKSTESNGSGGGGGYQVKEVELWEVHCRYECTDGTIDDIVVWYHQPTRRLVREIYADYPFAGRPYDKAVYFPTEGFYGIGMGEQLEMFQQAISDTFNFQNDNMLLGNSIGIVARAGSNIAPGEPIYPGMVKIVDGEVDKDFKSFQLGGGMNPGINAVLQQLQGLAQQRDAIGDLQHGDISAVPSRTPAGVVSSLLAEGRMRPDLTIKNLRYEGLSNVGLKVLQLIQANVQNEDDTGGAPFLQFAIDALGMPEGQEVAKKFAMPMEDVGLGLAVALTATNSSSNKEVEGQRYLSMLQVAGQVGGLVLQNQQVAVQFAGTPIADVAFKVSSGIVELFTRYLEQNDVRNIEAIVPAATTQAPDPLTALLGMGGSAGAVPGAGGGGGPAGILSGVPSVPLGAGAPV